METPNQDLVGPQFACPRCGERRIDYLALSEDGDEVDCGTCGFHYRLPGMDGGTEETAS